MGMVSCFLTFFGKGCGYGWMIMKLSGMVKRDPGMFVYPLQIVCRLAKSLIGGMWMHADRQAAAQAEVLPSCQLGEYKIIEDMVWA